MQQMCTSQKHSSAQLSIYITHVCSTQGNLYYSSLVATADCECTKVANCSAYAALVKYKFWDVAGHEFSFKNAADCTFQGCASWSVLASAKNSVVPVRALKGMAICYAYNSYEPGKSHVGHVWGVLSKPKKKLEKS